MSRGKYSIHSECYNKIKNAMKIVYQCYKAEKLIS